MEKQWIRLTGGDGTPGAWLNMAAVAAVRQDEYERLRIEMIGEQEHDPEKHPVITVPADIQAIHTYLDSVTANNSDPDLGYFAQGSASRPED